MEIKLDIPWGDYEKVETEIRTSMIYCTKQLRKTLTTYIRYIIAIDIFPKETKN